jgi:hypothetical protein
LFGIILVHGDETTARHFCRDMTHRGAYPEHVPPTFPSLQLIPVHIDA